MSLGKDIYCRGIEPYNFRDTKETVATITANVGQSTAIGPKVAIRKNIPFPDKGRVVAVDMGGGKSSSNITHNLSPTITCTHGGEPVIGTIDASIYQKNGFQDNAKYIIKKEIKMKEDNKNINATQCLEDAIDKGKDVVGAIDLSLQLLDIVVSKKMTMDEVQKTLTDLKNKLEIKRYSTMKDAIKEINADAPHQQDQLNCQDEAARTLAASTHGAASHLTKTVVEGEDDRGEEMCIVRRLTPTETARLQGFPDDYTKIDGPDTSDAPQFKSHGNSWATQCANFFSVRVEMELRRLGYEGIIHYATCCSGIEAHSVAVSALGWKSMFFSEIEPFPCRVLATHYPNTPNLGDMTQIHFDAEKSVITNSHKDGEEYSLPSCFIEAPIQEIAFKDGDLQVFSGGTPCQSISVAGKREGMAEGSGTRSSLAFHYQRIIDETKPMFTIWENVPGAFSSNGGADFIWFVNKCAESGYAMAWRVLDAQWTTTEEFPRAVPQRRRRIWLIGYKGNDWRVSARIAFELEKNLTSNPPERVPGKGFKTLNEDEVATVEDTTLSNAKPNGNEGLIGFEMDGVDSNKSLLKVSQMIDFSELPSESDFAKVPLASIYEFARKVGEPGYIGSVFRTDKKSKKKVVVETTLDLFGETEPNVETQVASSEEEDWVGAEKITPAILENIGNAGILANGRICTMNCHEWTSGIQLSPKTYNAWEKLVKSQEWEKANNLLPSAYDETVCGLSDVLQEDPDEKYNLSWRACFGILKRAETRGKELPPALEIALVSTIRENAGIVKWVALNGKDTKKSESDLSERESAMLCFQKFIAPVAKFEDVIAIQPKRKVEDEEESEDVEAECDEDGDNLPFNCDDDEGFSCSNKKIEKEHMPNLPNSVINVSGGETAATLIASGDAAVGTTQDANVIALKK